MKIISIKLLLLMSLSISNFSFSMSSDEADVESASSGLSSKDEETEIKLEDYYKQDIKTLDMSNLPLTDSVLKDMTDEIKALIVLVGAEQLILENNKLEVIPYDLITFALTNKTLKYVSFKNNKFKIQNGSPEPEYIETLMDKVYGKTKKKDGTTRPRSNTIGGVITTIWDGISPEIEKAIEKSNKSQDKTLLFKKIIIIDKRIPPLTVINQDQLPKSTGDKCKDVFYKILYVGGGIAVTLVPTLITYFTGTGTCDMNQLNTMMTNCNLSSYNYTL